MREHHAATCQKPAAVSGSGARQSFLLFEGKGTETSLSERGLSTSVKYPAVFRNEVYRPKHVTILFIQLILLAQK